MARPTYFLSTLRLKVVPLNHESLAEWAANVLMPYYYWSYQLKKSNRKPRLRLYYQQVVAVAAARLHADPLTHARLSTHWIRWAQAMINYAVPP